MTRELIPDTVRALPVSDRMDESGSGHGGHGGNR